ncbi:interferon gamma receptor 2 isoform X1 [Oryzias latipes]
METSRGTFTETERRLWTETALTVLLCLEAVGCAVMPPQNVSVNDLQLTWAPGSRDGGVLYTVEYRRFDNNTWQQVPACVDTPDTSCDFSSAAANATQGCIGLRVRSQERGVSSAAVPACSVYGSRCSPEVSLTAAPGIMTVRLSRNHHLGREYADNAQHRIYFGKEGEELNEDEDTPSSKTFSGLEVGQIYCAKVEFFLYGKPIGVPSCVRCELIPAQSTTEKTVKITSLVVGGIVLFIVPIIFYLLIFQRRKIKKLLKPYEIVIVTMVTAGRTMISNITLLLTCQVCHCNPTNRT